MAKRRRWIKYPWDPRRFPRFLPRHISPVSHFLHIDPYSLRAIEYQRGVGPMAGTKITGRSVSPNTNWIRKVAWKTHEILTCPALHSSGSTRATSHERWLIRWNRDKPLNKKANKPFFLFKWWGEGETNPATRTREIGAWRLEKSQSPCSAWEPFVLLLWRGGEREKMRTGTVLEPRS